MESVPLQCRSVIEWLCTSRLASAL